MFLTLVMVVDGARQVITGKLESCSNMISFSQPHLAWIQHIKENFAIPMNLWLSDDDKLALRSLAVSIS